MIDDVARFHREISVRGRLDNAGQGGRRSGLEGGYDSRVEEPGWLTVPVPWQQGLRSVVGRSAVESYA